MSAVTPNKTDSGHRQRLREQFTADPAGFSELELVELLLTYAIPRRDVAPLSESLLAEFGTIENLLAAKHGELTAIKGVGDNVATLVNLVTILSERRPLSGSDLKRSDNEIASDGVVEPSEQETDIAQTAKSATRRKSSTRTFTNDLAQAALDYLPQASKFQDVESYEQYLLETLPYNSASSRRRYTSNLTNRYFADGAIDTPLTLFLSHESDSSSVKAAIFYETVVVESALRIIAEKCIWPALPAGKILRERLHSFLTSTYAEVSPSTIQRMLYSVVNVYSILNGANADKVALHFRIRQGTLPAFLYLLSAQFPEPGIYNMDVLEAGPMRRWLLWDREWMRKQLYNLQDLGVVAKISEIDTIRQFSLTLSRTDALNHFYCHPQRSTIALREKRNP